MRYLAVLVALMLSPSAVAASCDSYIRISNEEARELMANMISPDVSPLDQLFAFETLMCADKTGLRDLTLRTAAVGDNQTILGQVLMRAIFEKEILELRLQQTDGMSLAQTSRIRKQPFERLAITQRDATAGCVAFYAGACAANSRYLGTLSGTTFLINVHWNEYSIIGTFEYDHGETLQGEVRIGDLVFPAEIDLF